jgi:hypothetical protein
MPVFRNASLSANARREVSHSRSRWRLRSGSGKSSYSVRACRVTEFFSHWMSPLANSMSRWKAGSAAISSIRSITARCSGERRGALAWRCEPRMYQPM